MPFFYFDLILKADISKSSLEFSVFVIEIRKGKQEDKVENDTRI